MSVVPVSSVIAKPINLAAAFFAAAVVLGPALLLWHLHGMWNPNGDYAYGWVVPLLAVFLCKARWDTRPAPSAPIAGAASLLVLFAMLALPARWLQEAAPERSVCAWSYALACIGISLSLISLAGGAAWLRWFAFPFAFLLTAVPWPHLLEALVSNSLMGRTAGATAEILCLLGVPSVQTGNLVHIENGVIDIDEACSGIRSLQAMVMISLFLGELFRLKPGRRILLVALGLAFTLVANVIRTVALSSIGFSRGMGAVDHYHDAAGFAVLILSLGATLFAAFKLRPAKTPAAMPGLQPLALTLPFNLSVGLLIWLMAIEVSVETWYRLHETKWQGWRWAVQWPRQAEDFRLVEIPKRSLRLLMCDESHAATWKGADGSEWSLYWVRWNPGNMQAEAAKVHRPDVCLNAEGAIMEKDMGMHFAPVGGIQVPFHGYIFRMGEKTLCVFFSVSEEDAGASPIGWNPQFESTEMIRRAFEGRRRAGVQSLEVAVSGYQSDTQARDAFDAWLGQLLQFRQTADGIARSETTVSGETGAIAR